MTMVMIRDDPNSSPETRVERRKRQTRERIFRAALDLFVKKGLDETTVAEITEAADVGKGTFFTYFPTKESVFAQVSEQLLEPMDAALDEATAAGASVEARVLAYFRPAVDWHASNPVLSRFMLGAFMRDRSYVEADRPGQQRLYERLARVLSEAQAAGEITRDVDVRAAITAIVGTYFGSLGAWHGRETTTPLVADFIQSLRIVFRGLKP
jgi:AcrR family transcriptional regulator